VRIDIEFDQGPPHQRVWVHPRFFSAPELVDRVRWQLEQCARDTPTDQEYPPGVVSVTYHALDPEDLGAHEPGLWGSGPDARVHQVFSRVQGLVGSHGVLTAHTHTGRLPQDSQLLSAWGEKEPHTTPENPLPGALPRPLPGTVFRSPAEVELVDEQGHEVRVVESSLSTPPVQMAWKNRRIRIESWAGPWPVCEQWWDPKLSRYLYRLQLLDERGVGWLVVADQTSQWQLAARYD
jgi:protein ImuB